MLTCGGHKICNRDRDRNSTCNCNYNNNNSSSSNWDNVTNDNTNSSFRYLHVDTWAAEWQEDRYTTRSTRSKCNSTQCRTGVRVAHRWGEDLRSGYQDMQAAEDQDRTWAMQAQGGW